MRHSPFSNQLHTNYTPTLSERIAIKNLLVTPNDQIREIDSDINRLSLKRSQLSTFVKAHNALLSPIRCLCPEILQAIFIECLHQYPSYPAMHVSEAPLLLGRVCRLW
jgi:hypothetical protein